MLEKSSLPSLSLQLQSSSQGRDLFTLFVRVKMITITRFKYIVEGIIVPQISLLGVIANTLTILVLNHSDVKLKKSLVDILCGLATFDNLFLISIFPMFTLPVLSEWWVLMRFFLFQFLGEILQIPRIKCRLHYQGDRGDFPRDMIFLMKCTTFFNAFFSQKMSLGKSISGVIFVIFFIPWHLYVCN